MTVPLQRLNTQLAVWRRVLVSDTSGGRSAQWRYLVTVRARVLQPSVEQRFIAAQAGAELTHLAYFLPSTDVQRGDELRRGDLVLRVNSVTAPSAPVYLRAECEQTLAEQRPASG